MLSVLSEAVRKSSEKVWALGSEPPLVFECGPLASNENLTWEISFCNLDRNVKLPSEVFPSVGEGLYYSGKYSKNSEM